MVGAVGDDEYGASALADLAREGVDVSRIAVMEGESTGIALIAVDERGANQIVVAPGANHAFGAAAIEEALAGYEPRAGSVAVLSFELGDEAIFAAARYAAAHGMRMLVNPAPARELPAALVALAPIVLPNEGEAATLTGLSDPGEAARSLSAGRARRSSLPSAPREPSCANPVKQEGSCPHPRSRSFDTTGAGDAFVGALAAVSGRRQAVARGSGRGDRGSVQIGDLSRGPLMTTCPSTSREPRLLGRDGRRMGRARPAQLAAG